MAKSYSNLIYFVSETHYFARDYSVLGVTLVGPLVMTNATTFLECTEQITQSLSKCVILNFRDVPPEVDMDFIPLIDKLLKSIRARPAFVRLSGLHPELKQIFQERAVVQLDELANNLADALNSLPPIGSSVKKA